jgi:hypothetical protein
MRNSLLVFGRTIVSGGAYAGTGNDHFYGSRFMEQVTRRWSSRKFS